MTPDFGASKTVRNRWKKGAGIRAMKRRLYRLVRSARASRESVSAALAMLRRPRKPRTLAECSPAQKAVFIALLNGQGR
jgi:hypothetical protein